MKRSLNKYIFCIFLVTGGLFLSGCSSGDEEDEIKNIVKTVQGENFDLDNFVSQKNTLVFYYTYGDPCLKTFPEIKKVVEDCTEDVNVIAVESGGQPEQKAKDLINNFNLNFPVLTSNQAETAGAFDLYPALRGLPTTLFLDSSGQTRHIQPGQMDSMLIKTILQAKQC